MSTILLSQLETSFLLDINVDKIEDILTSNFTALKISGGLHRSTGRVAAPRESFNPDCPIYIPADPR